VKERKHFEYHHRDPLEIRLIDDKLWRIRGTRCRLRELHKAIECVLDKDDGAAQVVRGVHCISGELPGNLIIEELVPL